MTTEFRRFVSSCSGDIILHSSSDVALQGVGLKRLEMSMIRSDLRVRLLSSSTQNPKPHSPKAPNP